MRRLSSVFVNWFVSGTAMRAGCKAHTTTLASNVRIGRVMNLEYLVALVGYGLPDFPTSAELLLATPARIDALLFPF